MGAADRVRQRWRHALVVFEITVTIALLVQTSAMIDGYRRAMRADMGFATAPLITARVENSAGVQVSPLIDAIRALPGVEAAAVSTSIPFGARGASVRVTAAAAARGAEAINAEHAADHAGVLPGARRAASRGTCVRRGRVAHAAHGDHQRHARRTPLRRSPPRHRRHHPHRRHAPRHRRHRRRLRESSAAASAEHAACVHAAAAAVAGHCHDERCLAGEVSAHAADRDDRNATPPPARRDAC